MNKQLQIVLLMVVFLAGCGATVESNMRSASLSRANVAGVLLPNHGPGGVNSYSIISEEAVPIPADQTHLLGVIIFVPGFFSAEGFYKYSLMTKILDISPKNDKLVIASVGNPRAGRQRLADYYAVTIPRSSIGTEFKIKIAYRIEVEQQPNADGQKLFTGTETLRINVMDDEFAKVRSEKWNRDVRLFQNIPPNWIKKDLGEIAVEEGMIIFDGAERYKKLKEDAARRGATAITDLKMVTSSPRNVGPIARQAGFTARAVILGNEAPE